MPKSSSEFSTEELTLPLAGTAPVAVVEFEFVTTPSGLDTSDDTAG